jgi:hypothetical protein
MLAASMSEQALGELVWRQGWQANQVQQQTKSLEQPRNLGQIAPANSCSTAQKLQPGALSPLVTAVLSASTPQQALGNSARRQGWQAHQLQH